MQLRLSTPEDVQVMTDVFNEAREHKLQFDNAWELPFTHQEVATMQQRGSLYAATQTADRIVGCVQLLEEDPRIWGQQGTDGTSLYIHKLATSETVRGKNVGGKILELAEELATNDNKDFLRLDCPGDNNKLINYYERNGFALVGYTAVQGNKNLDTTFRAAKMQKTL